MIHSKLTPLLALGAFTSFACAAAPGTSTGTEDAPLASSSAGLTRNALTTAEQKTALELIDDICGDTWCDGDDDFRFDALECNTRARSCTLSLELLPRAGVPSAAPDYHRTCRTGDFTGFASLVATATNGQQSLNQDYYFALTECISTLEAELPPPPTPCPAASVPVKAFVPR